MSTFAPRLLLGASLALTTTLVFSLVTAMTKYTASFVSIEQIILVQYLVCVVIMTPHMYRRGARFLKTAAPVLHVIRGMSGWLCFYTFYLAIDRIPLAEATLLRSSGPIFVPILLYFWKGFRMPLLRWVPVITGFIGIVFVLRPEGTSLSFWHLVALASAIMLAGSIVTTHVLAASEPTSRILFYYFSLSVLCSIPLAISNWRPIPLFALFCMVGIGLSIWLTMWLYTLAYSYAKATVISPLGYCGILFTAILGWYFWGQIPDRSAVIGAILIISGGLGSVYLGRNKALF